MLPNNLLVRVEISGIVQMKSLFHIVDQPENFCTTIEGAGILRINPEQAYKHSSVDRHLSSRVSSH
jgi:hypothetical protein